MQQVVDVNEVINPRQYNCAGFALGTMTWLCPEGAEVFDLAENFDSLVRGLLENFPHLRQVKSPRGVHSSRKVIGFRVEKSPFKGMVPDFHFIIRINGVWYEKPGDAPVKHFRQNRRERTLFEPWSNEWAHYDSEIAWFVVQSWWKG